MDKSGWQLVFEDDFSDPATLGPESKKWSKGYYFGHETPTLNCATQYDHSTWDNIVVHDGVADFFVRDVSAAPIYVDECQKSYSYTSGAITSKVDDVASSGCVSNGSSIQGRGFLYGLFEIKCKMPKGPGRLGAFWLYGAREVDVFEYGGYTPNRISANVHWDWDKVMYNCQTVYDTALPDDLTEEYHVYALAWTPTSLTWFFDGREIRTETDRGDHRIPVGCEWGRMYVCIDSEVRTPFLPDLSSPFSVDYVRVYKPTNGDYATTAYRQAPAPARGGVNPVLPVGRPPLPFSGLLGAAPSRELATDGSRVFYRTRDNGLQGLAAANGAWTDLSLTVPVANVAGNVACSPQPGHVFYSDKKGRLFHLREDQGWASTCLDESVADVLNNVTCAPDSLEVYYVNKARRIAYFRPRGGQWDNLELPGVVRVASGEKAFALRDNFIFYNDGKGGLWYAERTAGRWGPPTPIAAVTNVSHSLVVERRPGSTGLEGLRVYYIGTDQSVYNASLDHGQWVAYCHSRQAANARSGLTVTGYDTIYYKGTDGRLWHQYYYEGAWRTLPVSYASLTNIWGGLGTTQDGRVHVVNRNKELVSVSDLVTPTVNPVCDSVSVLSE